MPHQVEVDDEVFAFVQSHAEPLIDTFNTSLRRLLPLVPAKEGTASSVAKSARSERPVFPGGTPKALKQIIEVALLVRGGAYDRTSATHVVADRIESRCKQYSTNMPGNLDSIHNNSIVYLTKQTSKS